MTRQEILNEIEYYKDLLQWASGDKYLQCKDKLKMLKKKLKDLDAMQKQVER